MNLKVTLILIFLSFPVLFTSDVCVANTIYLKDGRTIQSNTVWPEGNFYKYKMYEATIGISKGKVEKVVYIEKKKKSEFQYDVWPFGGQKKPNTKKYLPHQTETGHGITS